MARRTALMVVTLAGMAEHMVSMLEKSGGEREREERRREKRSGPTTRRRGRQRGCAAVRSPRRRHST
jgi:hypothetical protein